MSKAKSFYSVGEDVIETRKLDPFRVVKRTRVENILADGSLITESGSLYNRFGMAPKSRGEYGSIRKLGSYSKSG